MSKVLFSNNAEATLDGNILASATSFSVQAGDGALFPSPGTDEIFYVRLGTDSNNEVVTITARSTDTFTCEATDGAWNDETPVRLTLPTEALESFVQLDGNGQVIQDSELKDYSETKTSPSSSSAVLDLDLENGNVFEVTLTEDVTTLTFSNPPASGKAGSFTLILHQDGTGGWEITWPGSVDWADGEEPELTADASATDILCFITTDAGTTWYGFSAGADFS